MDLTTATIIFAACAIVIAIAGTRLTKLADQLADLTGLGEAVFGAIFLGGVTSLPGITTSVTAAIDGLPELAVSNAIGGIAAQTVFLSVADIVYPRINLEHASASFPNLMSGVLLIMMLALILVTMSGPEVTVLGVHPVSIILVIVYVWGNKLISKARQDPMWSPTETKETVPDEPEEENVSNVSLKATVLKFIGLALLVAVAGYFISKSGAIISEETGLSQGVVGSIFTAIATSLPELIVSITAVRNGALTMAVANIIGGNTFDVLFVAFADVGYQDGSILHSVGKDQSFIIAETIFMTGVLLLGLLHRQKRGIGGIGWETVTVIGIYILGIIIMVNS
jgi:cation:H+ antiporter